MNPATTPLADGDFDFVRKLLLDRCGIALEPDKRYLVESRLAPVAKQLNLPSIGHLVERLRADPGNGLPTKVVEAMVTHETSFFRDLNPFEALRKVVVPALVEARAGERRLDVWCAACSTGQEPYSLALLLREYFPEVAAGWKVSILATDISRPVLDRARAGVFNQIEANRGVPAALLVKYFKQKGTTWELAPEVRAMVEFRELNLVAPLPFGGQKFDLVFLRNVMIYFDVPTKKALLGRVARLLRPDGYLLLGGAETTFNLDDSFRRVEIHKTGFYQLVK